MKGPIGLLGRFLSMEGIFRCSHCMSVIGSREVGSAIALELLISKGAASPLRQNETHEGRIIAQTCVDIFVKNGSNRQWLRETFLRITAIICQVFQLLCYIIIVWHGKSCRLTMLGYKSSNLGALIVTNRNNLYRYHELCTQLNQHQRYRLKHNHFKIHRCKYRHQRSLPEPFDIYCLKRCCRKKTLAEPAKNTCWLLLCAFPVTIMLPLSKILRLLNTDYVGRDSRPAL